MTRQRRTYAAAPDRISEAGLRTASVRQEQGTNGGSRRNAQSKATERSAMSEDILIRLERLECMIALLLERQTIREFYSTEEFARLVGRSEFTVREYCRLGRIKAEKRMSGRGAYPAWCISHDELLRFQRQGLLPLRRA
jgi:Helix-turn-helix domain